MNSVIHEEISEGMQSFNMLFLLKEMETSM